MCIVMKCLKQMKTREGTAKMLRIEWHSVLRKWHVYAVQGVCSITVWLMQMETMAIRVSVIPVMTTTVKSGLHLQSFHYSYRVCGATGP